MLNQTPVSEMDPENRFDAVGIKEITDITKKAYKEKEQIIKDTDVAVKGIEVEAAKKKYVLDKDKAWAQAEMEKDVARLGKISSRFESVGSSPRGQAVSVSAVARNTVEYFRRRLPRVGHGIKIVEHHSDGPCVNGNPALLEWVIENLLKNAVESIDKPEGVIEVTSRFRRADHSMEIIIKDNGRGMNAAERDKAFTPGYSSKRRGWGLDITF